MNKRINKIARELRVALKEYVKDFQGFYIFGSQAEGIANRESDLDIVIIFKNKRSKENDKYYEIISQFMYKYDIVLDVHRRTKKELESNCIFADQVINKGIFYEAA